MRGQVFMLFQSQQIWVPLSVASKALSVLVRRSPTIRALDVIMLLLSSSSEAYEMPGTWSRKC